MTKPTVSRRSFFAGGAALVASPAVLRIPRAQAAEITLKLAHFLPPVSNVHKKLLVPFAEQVEKATGGKAKIEIFPSMQLGGKPPQLYDQARDGLADMAWTLPGYTAGRFPATEVFELPFVASKRGIVNARAAQEFAGEFLKEETKDVKLLCYWAHDAGVIHATKPVKTMDDLKGLKLRFPTRLAGEALSALGASTIGMPVPKVPESLAQRVIDGCVIPWEVVPAIKVHELVSNHTEIPGSPTLYTACFFLTMNKAKYEGLPGDVRDAIDAASGMTFATNAGHMWDNAGAEVRAMVEKKGNSIVEISAEERARWEAATKGVVDKWLAEAKGKGLPAEKMLETAKGLLAKYEKA